MRASRTGVCGLFLVVLTLLALADGKSSKPSLDMRQYFEKRLATLHRPSAVEIRNRGILRDYPRAAREHVWNSVIKVAIQQGLVVYSSRSEGVLVVVAGLLAKAPEEQNGPLAADPAPLCNVVAFLVEEEKDGGCRLYVKAERPISSGFFERLATQIEAAGRWEYLRKGKVR